MSRIFISYRRADSIAITGRIYDYLVLVFGEDSIFKDVDDIPLGADFRAVLEREVGSCDALLVVIGPQWANVAFKDGRKRLHDPTDFVRIEVESGLRRGEILVVPVLVDDATMPTADELPESLYNLRYRNAAIVRHDPDFRRDMERLTRQLQRYFEGSGEVNNVLIQLDALPEDTTWAEIEALLEQAHTAADGDETLIAKIDARREHRLAHREQRIAALIHQANDLLAAEPPDVEQALSLLDDVQALMIDQTHFADDRNRILQFVDEVRAREQAAEQERQRQEAEQLAQQEAQALERRREFLRETLRQAERGIKQDPPDLQHIEVLVNDADFEAVNDPALNSRRDALRQELAAWRSILEERQQAQFEAEKRQRVEQMLFEAESLMQSAAPDTRKIETLLAAVRAENLNDAAIESRWRAVRQQLNEWRDAEYQRLKTQQDEERRRQQEARQAAQQKMAQSVSRMEAVDAEARRLSEPPPTLYAERRLSLPRSRGLVIAAVAVILVIAVFVFSSQQRGNQAAAPTPTPTPTPTNVPMANLSIGNVFISPARCLEPFTVQIEIVNGGTATASAGTLTVRDEHAVTGIEQGSHTLSFGSIPPGEQALVELELTISAFYNEYHNLIVTLNPNGSFEGHNNDITGSYSYLLSQGDCLRDETAATAEPTAEVIFPSGPTRTMTPTPTFTNTSAVSNNSIAVTATLLANSSVNVFSLSGNANVRAGDSTEYGIVGQLREGETGRAIAISSRGTGWYLIRTPDRRYGWIAPSVVSVQGNTSSLPRVAPPSL